MHGPQRPHSPRHTPTFMLLQSTMPMQHSSSPSLKDLRAAQYALSESLARLVSSQYACSSRQAVRTPCSPTPTQPSGMLPKPPCTSGTPSKSVSRSVVMCACVVPCGHSKACMQPHLWSLYRIHAALFLCGCTPPQQRPQLYTNMI